MKRWKPQFTWENYSFYEDGTVEYYGKVMNFTWKWNPETNEIVAISGYDDRKSTFYKEVTEVYKKLVLDGVVK